MSFASLPIIDLQQDESTIIQSIFDACSTTGFFYLRHHNLLEKQQQMFALAKEYFNLSVEVKEKHSIGKNNQGYVHRGQENLDSTNKKLFDDKEAFNIGKFLWSDLPDLFMEPKNLKLIQEFQRDCHNLQMKLLTYLAKSFSIAPDYFTSRHQWELESGETLRLLHYPPVQCHTDESIRAGAHSDYGSLTLLFQHDGKSGLEVLDRSTNIWHPVQPFEDMIVVNFGDAFEYWSNGFIKSTVHRVVAPILDLNKNSERYSIAFFGHPNHSTLLTPIPSPIVLNRKFDKDAHSKHALDDHDGTTLTAGEHLQVRLQKTYAY